MKTNIHPKYDEINVKCASGNVFATRSTLGHDLSADICSNCERVRFISRCLGPVASAVTKGRFISVSVAVESSIFARSAASLSLCRAILSLLRSMPFDFLNEFLG